VRAIDTHTQHTHHTHTTTHTHTHTSEEGTMIQWRDPGRANARHQVTPWRLGCGYRKAQSLNQTLLPKQGWQRARRLSCGRNRIAPLKRQKVSFSPSCSLPLAPDLSSALSPCCRPLSCLRTSPCSRSRVPPSPNKNVHERRERERERERERRLLTSEKKRKRARAKRA